MITDTISNIFDFISETNIVEEYFYHKKGIYPVYSGQTTNDGVVALIDTYVKDEECLTFTTYGSGAGKLSYRQGKYTVGRNCMGLIPKERYKPNMINLKWFAYSFQNLFYSLCIGDLTGQRSLNKTLVENIKITIPVVDIQNKELRLYEESANLACHLESVINDIDLLMTSKVLFTDIMSEQPLSEIFDIVGGNSGLTEEFIYYNQPSNLNESLPILSGSTKGDLIIGYVSENAVINSNPLKKFTGECIIVSRKGKAGTMNYWSSKKFTINDDAYVMVLKKDWAKKVNLRWFVQYYQSLFYNLVTSKSDNATFNKEYAERQIIKIPGNKYQKKMGNLLNNLIEAKREIQQSLADVNSLLLCEIVL